MADSRSIGRPSVVGKVAAILRTVRLCGSLTVTEIAHLTEIPLSTTHRLVVELADRQLLERGEDGQYGLVHATPTPCICRPAPRRLRDVAAPVIEDLGGATSRHVRLGLLSGLRVHYVEKPYGSRPITNMSPAATLPAHATAVGQALLAFSPSDVVERTVAQGLPRYTASTPATAVGLRHVLRLVRLRGVAVASGTLRHGHSAAAAPVFGLGGQIAAALEVPLSDLEEDLLTVVPMLTLAARALSRDLGRSAPSELGGRGGRTAPVSLGCGEPCCGQVALHEPTPVPISL